MTQFDAPVIEEQLRRIGARFDPEVLKETRALYRDSVRTLEWAGRPGDCDIAYGEHERRRVDVYPADRADAPVILFVHGGGFVGGDKRGDEVFYGNVGRYFAHHGFLTVLANYRLAPEWRWPSGMEDIAAAIGWVKGHAGEYGGDASRIVLIGQSAGAAHVSGCLFDPRSAVRGDPAIKAAALMSGFYRAKNPLEGGPRVYFGDDESAWPDRSVTTHVTSGHPPILLSVAEFDPAFIADQTFELAIALNAADGQPPRIAWYAGQNHVSTIHGLGLGDDAVGRQLREFAAKALR